MNKSATGRVVLLSFLALFFLSSDGETATKRSYIGRYVLLMDWTERAMLWVEKHRDDPLLGKAALDIAETNIKIVQDLSPPKEFREVHPHFVSIIENSANAFEAISTGNVATFYKYKKRIESERKSLLEVMRSLNFVLPTII